MPGCSAYHCSNSSSKGFKMCHFPSNIERRKIWLEKVARKNWAATPNATLCEVHFEPSMWEKTRVDGKRKLKSNAIPTLFGEESQNSNAIIENVDIAGELLLSSQSPDHEEVNEPDESGFSANKSELSEEISNDDAGQLNNGTQEDQSLDQLEKLFADSERLRKRIKKKLRMAKRNMQDSKIPQDD